MFYHVFYSVILFFPFAYDFSLTSLIILILIFISLSLLSVKYYYCMASHFHCDFCICLNNYIK